MSGETNETTTTNPNDLEATMDTTTTSETVVADVRCPTCGRRLLCGEARERFESLVEADHAMGPCDDFDHYAANDVCDRTCDGCDDEPDWSDPRYGTADDPRYDGIGNGMTWSGPEHVEVRAYPAIVVGQGGGAAAARALREAGYKLLGQGYSDGSTTWTIVLCDEVEEPVAVERANAARDLLWDRGWGWVEVVEHGVEV